MEMNKTFRYLEQVIRPNSHAIEIGVFKARFSLTFLQRLRPEKLILIDPWQNVSDTAHRFAWYHNDRGNDMEAIYSDVLTAMDKHIKDGHVEVFRATSREVLPKLPSDLFDFVFVDGDHLYDPVLFDLEESYKKLKIGGIMLIDDYKLDAKFWWGDGVVRAVHDFLALHSSNVILEHIDNGVVALKRLA